MNHQELSQAIQELSRERDWQQFHTPKNLAMAISVEASELLEIFQWLTPEESQNLTPQQLADARDEMGDVLILLMNLASRLNVNLLEAASQKLEKVKAKYPVDKAKGSSAKYDKL